MEKQQKIAIFLNGASSSGKTTIAKDLIKSLKGSWLYLSVDDCLNRGGNMSDFHKDIFEKIRLYNLIIDHVLERKSWYEECKLALQKAQCVWVLVECDPKDSLLREKKRRNRQLGLASKQLDMFKEYDYVSDLIINTSKLAKNKVTKIIKSYIYSKNSHNTRSDSKLTTSLFS